FFQAEDGIRDFHVTGVQTCALPISAPACGSEVESARGRFAAAGAGFGAAVTAFAGAASASTTATAPPAAAAFTTLASRATEGLRSEERRVGKESRSRWAPGHARKKK